MIHQVQYLVVSSLSFIIAVMATQNVNFDLSYVELDSAKMIHTDDNHYSISSPNLPSKWRCVSVNGHNLDIVKRDNSLSSLSYDSLVQSEKDTLNNIKSQLNQIITNGPFNVASQTGLAKITKFDRYGGASSMGSGGSSSSSSSSSSSNGMSVSRFGPNSYIVGKTDFPLGWYKIIVNDDLTTIVYNDGRVVMKPLSLIDRNERDRLNSIRQEVDKLSQATHQLGSMFSGSGSFSSSPTSGAGAGAIASAGPNSGSFNPFSFVQRAMGGMFG